MLSRLISLLVILFCTSLSAAETRSLVIASLEHPPYVTETLQGKGWAWELAEKAFISQGYKVDLKVLPWSRALKMAKLGQVDAIYLANKSPEREEWAYFSDRFGDEEAVLWKRTDLNFSFETLSELKVFRVGGLRSSFQQRYLESKGLEVIGLNNFTQGLRMLHLKRIDLLIADKLVATHLLNGLPQTLRDNLNYIMPPVNTAGLFLAAPFKVKNHKEIVDAFNRGLDIIRSTGEYSRILEKYNLL